MPLINQGAARLYFEDSGGDGLPILLSHGFGASTEMWRGQVENFGNRYRLITWDMRGHGRTECPDDLGLYSKNTQPTIWPLCWITWALRAPLSAAIPLVLHVPGL